MENPKAPDSIYRTYDVRGIYGKEINEDTADKIGAAFAQYIGHGKRVAFGRDIRHGSREMSERMLAALSGNGLDVMDLGLVPTPMVYFTIRHNGLDGGIMVTASHNPKEWNGFKIFGANGKILGMGSGLEDIKRIVDSGMKGAQAGGSVTDFSADALRDYSSTVVQKSGAASIPMHKLRIGLDTGNGSYSIIGPQIMRQAGIDVIPMNDAYDPEFGGRGPEPKEGTLDGLSRLVVEKKLDFGVAFDADGDRAVFVDDKGSIIRGDVSLSLFIKSLARPSDRIVYEISCSKVVEDMIAQVGAVPVPSRIGRRFILENMERERARLGGEISSHTYFSELYNGDDALFSAMAMYCIVARTGKRLSELIAEMPHYELEALEIPVDEKEKHRIVDEARGRAQAEGLETVLIDGVKVIGGDWRFVIRPSNTTPAIRLVAESRTRQGLDKAVSMAKSLLGMQ